MRFKVLSYNKQENYHICFDIRKSQSHKLDIFVDGLDGFTNENIVGKIIDVDYLAPYIEIATGVRVVGEECDERT